MPQIYHANAQTNQTIRLQIQNSTQTNATLAERFGTSSTTISKWKIEHLVMINHLLLK
ncbi:hypothetical protein ACE193_14875 [Bernardetia sp. OM2101]|uniref:hypothetical protein n=1 Tax=Bernardetia sp. OM2101 TaxID=3344876 RepID=UPI0035CEEC00